MTFRNRASARMLAVWPLTGDEADSYQAYSQWYLDTYGSPVPDDEDSSVELAHVIDFLHYQAGMGISS